MPAEPRAARGDGERDTKKGNAVIRAKGRCEDQKLQLEKPLDLPEGTEVEVVIRTAEEMRAEEEQAWERLGMSRLEEEWDNPQDAVYDNWRKLYGMDGR
jgi:hypothetical protein